jgi:hypothetical protein
MNCEEATKLAGDLHDDLLDSSLREDLKDHFSVCLSCDSVQRQFQELSKWLRKSSILPPPESLFLGLIEAFETQHKKPKEAAQSWPRNFFTGSVSIPKPALAVAIVLIMAAITASNLVEWKAALYDGAAANSSQTVQAKIVEVPVTQFVEVPTVKERIVNRIVYINGQARNSAARDKTLQNGSKQSGEIRNNSIADNKFLTRTSLKGFRPLPVFKARVLDEENPNEK